MADVFISYASADRESPIRLDAALEAAGFSVWWDRELLAGRPFQESIVAELNRAAAVVVVWSRHSVGSEWVYSEARRGSDQGKLVQVRTADVTIDELPAPFDAYHCPLVCDTDAVVRAVRALADGAGSSAADIRRPPALAGTLPRGTVTLLRADVDHSALRVHDLGDAWLAALTRYREVGREVVTARHGQTLPADHDALFAAFATADLQCRLLADPDAPVTVRVAVHTGTPQLLGDGYAGLDVDRAVGVAAAAHPGQVLLTEPTAGLVWGALPAGRHTMDLGEHQLRDLPGRIGLHQLVDPDLPLDFPALRTLGAAGSLPTNLAPIVGRDAELAELAALLHAGERLVTLVGPGGTGKTRLAVAVADEAAARFADGVYFVPLSSVTAASDIWGAMATVLELPPDGQAGPGFLEHVVGRRLLLVLDNLEQIAEAHTVVRELLASARQVSVVATSRRPLHVSGEREYAVTPLSLPADASLSGARASAAVGMFVEAAARVRRGFELTDANAADVAALCAALDGLPLALELTAARAKLLSPAAILARIEQTLDHVSADRSRDLRQLTLRSAITWSVDLLEDHQRAVLEILGVFEGGASLAAVEATLPDEHRHLDAVEVLFDLVDASLVSVAEDVDGEPRFSLLQTVKRFARERLGEAGTLVAGRRRHAQYFYDLAARHWADREDPSYGGVRQALLSDLENLRAVAENPEPGVRDERYDGPVPRGHVGVLLAGHAFALRRYTEALAWCGPALAAGSDAVGRSAAFASTAQTRLWSSDFEGAVAAGRSALAEVDGDRAPGTLPPWVDPTTTRLTALTCVGSASFMLGKVADALAMLAPIRALSTRPGDPPHLEALEAAYYIGVRTGDLPAARGALEEMLAVGGADGGPRRLMIVNGLADLDTREGRYATAQARLVSGAEAAIAAGDIEHIMLQAETMAESVGLREPRLYARVRGSAAATRARLGKSATHELDDVIADIDERVKALMPPAEHAAAVERGRGEDLVDLIREMAALPPGEPD